MNALLALPILLAPQAPPADGGAPAGAIAYEIRLVDCETLGWRSDFQARLRFGGHRAGSSAWVADESTMADMVASFMEGPDARVVAAPKVAATPGDPAVVGTSTTRHFVVHAEPEPEPGPVAEAEGEPMLPRPVVAPVDDGSQVRLVGRPGPEGMHLKVEVIDSRVGQVHVIEAGNKAGDSFKVQVPEVTRREVGGEWVLPEHHGLVLSLGVESSADPEGKPAVRERLLLISTRPMGPAPGAPAADPSVRLTGATPTPTPAIPAPMIADGPLPTAAASVPVTPPSPTMEGVAFQPAGPIAALAATPWGLLPIVPVDVVASAPVGAEAGAAKVAMSLPALPSRTLPAAIDTKGRSIDPRTEKDRQAEQTNHTPYVDGKPVPSPQVTLATPGMSIAETSGDAAARPNSAEATPGEPKEDRSMIRVRFSIDLARGFVVDVDLGKTPEPAEQQADAGEPPARR